MGEELIFQNCKRRKKQKNREIKSHQKGQDSNNFVANKRRQGTGRPNAPGPVHFRRLWLRHFRDCNEDQCLCAKLIISKFYSSLAIHLTLIHTYILLSAFCLAPHITQLNFSACIMSTY